MFEEGRCSFSVFLMKANALQTRLLFIPGAILTKINDIFVNCLSAEAVKCIPKAESEIDFMFAYEHMRIGVQIVAAAEHVIDDHEEGAFPDGVTSGLCSEHCV